MPGGYRSECYFCHNSILSRDIGSHILKHHETALFDDYNRSYLWYDTSLSKPLRLKMGTETYYFCFADNSCIRKEIIATEHFKGREEKHKEAVLKLREKYPRGNKETQPSTQPLLSDKERKAIQQDIASIVATLKALEKKYPDDDTDYSFSKAALLGFSKLGIKVDEKSLTEMYPALFPEPEKEPEPEPEVKEEDLLPLYYEKPLTKEEVMKQMFSPEDIKNLKTSIVTGKEVSVPELDALVEPAKPKRRAKVVKVTEPEPVKEPEPILDYKPPTPWEMLVSANPHLTTNAQRLAEARYMGFPESQIPPEILHPQTAARPITVPPPTQETPPDRPRIIFTTKRVVKAVTS